MVVSSSACWLVLLSKYGWLDAARGKMCVQNSGSANKSTWTVLITAQHKHHFKTAAHIRRNDQVHMHTNCLLYVWGHIHSSKKRHTDTCWCNARCTLTKAFIIAFSIREQIKKSWRTYLPGLLCIQANSLSRHYFVAVLLAVFSGVCFWWQKAVTTFTVNGSG